MRYLVVAVALVVACAADQPSVDAWTEERWAPIVDVVPEPGNATPSACEEALGELRERAPGLDPAPSDALREAVHAWLNEAESLMFSCSSEPDFDYAAGLERLRLLQAEVEAVLERS